jgi:UDP-N-acetylmuramoylalanine--D-glutamate ligase
MKATPRDLEGLPVTVMGLGLFGGGAAVSRWLAAQGAHVTVTDLRTAEELAPALRGLEGLPLRFVLGEHRTEDFTQAALVVANPAVPPRSPFLEAARATGATVTSEMALFLERCPARIAAVTGTQGKSSTCNTLAQLLTASGFRVHLGGNIGRSLLESTGEMRPQDVAVVEISSYQLEAFPGRLDTRGEPPHVEVVAVTNVLADHLERHGSVEAYAAAKRRILPLAAAAGGTAVLSAEDSRVARWSEPGLRRIDFFPTRASDAGLNRLDGRFRLDLEVLGRASDLHIHGDFQRENTLMALGIARILGARADVLANALPNVTALPHRLEDLGVRRGHRVWDNGVSTTPDSTLSALASIAPGCTLMCGGKAKNLPLGELVDTVRARVRRTVVFGDAADLFGSAFRSAGIETWAAPTVEAAVAIAFERMEKGAELLFSPAAASFDAYLNFRERALAFRRALPPVDGEPAPAVR